MAQTKTLLARLAEGVVIGDGGFGFALEKLGYVKVGVWTPECTVLHPNAVRELHRAFLRAGSDVMQSFNFLSSESKLSTTEERLGKKLPSGKEINLAAYKLAREVADEGNALVSISLSEPTSVLKGQPKEVVQPEMWRQIRFFIEERCDIDFVACEYYSRIESLEWAIEVCKEFDLTVAATMCIGPSQDQHGVPAGECAVRMARAGADLVGVNCNYGPPTCLETIKLMKEALDKENLKPYLMTQPLGFFTPEVKSGEGYCDIPGHFLAYEPRVCTRFEMQNYARKAYELGVRYIGGCCGTEPYHIRAMAEELSAERKMIPPVTREFGDILSGIRDNPWKRISDRSDKEYWQNFKPSTGRPESSAFAPFLFKD